MNRFSLVVCDGKRTLRVNESRYQNRNLGGTAIESSHDNNCCHGIFICQKPMTNLLLEKGEMRWLN